MTTNPERTLVAIDTETTSLNPEIRQPWEIGYITRTPDGTESENQIFINIDDLNLNIADPIALHIGRFHQRHPQAQPHWVPTQNSNVMPMSEALTLVEQATRNALIIGAVPWFDTETIETHLRQRGLIPGSWHYHLIDVETLAAGRLGIRPPWNFDGILAQFGLTYDESDRHTALGDARMALRLYDRLYSHLPAGGLPSAEDMARVFADDLDKMRRAEDPALRAFGWDDITQADKHRRTRAMSFIRIRILDHLTGVKFRNEDTR